jgi:hypothetical protein
MTLVPFTNCCAMLGIDAKTLRNWLRQANLAWAAHPKDARLKCLTSEQVERLATLHARPLPLPVSAPAVLPEAAPAKPESEAPLLEASLLLPISSSAEADLRKQLSCLETKMTIMQEQLAQLALCVLGEREVRYEQRLKALEALLPQTLDPPACPPAPQAPAAQEPPQGPSTYGRPLHPAEQRARSRLIPLIEYGASGQYVVICPELGELALTLDSPEWFAWLATLSSFRFVGQQGRFTAYRKGRMSRRWSAYRTMHQHDYQHYLGTTDHLTIDCLEQMAAKLQSHMAAL